MKVLGMKLEGLSCKVLIKSQTVSDTRLRKIERSKLINLLRFEEREIGEIVAVSFCEYRCCRLGSQKALICLVF